MALYASINIDNVYNDVVHIVNYQVENFSRTTSQSDILFILKKIKYVDGISFVLSRERGDLFSTFFTYDSCN